MAPIDREVVCSKTEIWSFQAGQVGGTRRPC
jgi:hypothetical protein